MANGTNFKGANTRYRPPEGVSEEQCHTLSVFKNGTCIVACWEISDGEIIELIRTRKIFTSVWSGNTLYPMAVGAESLMRPLVADFGPVWTPENKEQPNYWFDAAKATIDKLSKEEQFKLAWQIAEMIGQDIEPNRMKLEKEFEDKPEQPRDEPIAYQMTDDNGEWLDPMPARDINQVKRRYATALAEGRTKIRPLYLNGNCDGTNQSG